MLIDWFTVGAQALNFLILVWLLKRFLYKPILDAVDAREARIAGELADADARKVEARQERDEFRKRNEAFDRERAGLMDRAVAEVKAERSRLLEEVAKAADALAARRRAGLAVEARNLNRAVGDRARQEVFAVARRTLQDLAAASLEERLCELFIRRLREMDGPARKNLKAAFEASAEPGLVRSAFDIPAAQRAAIEAAVAETISAGIDLRYDTSPDLIAGIELSANGQKLAWNMADYLAALEKSVGELLETRWVPQAGTTA
jgi:F-type H+-transporting ATPase subunit b